jgi:hypothetical protein
MSPKTITTNHINFTAIIKVHRDMGYIGTIITCTNHTKFLGLTIEYADLGKMYRRGNKETEYSLLYDKKYKTSGVYENINKYLSFIFPFYWGTLSYAERVFKLLKRVIRLIKGCRYRESCREHFRDMNILLLRSQYIHSLTMFVLKQINI